MDGSTNYDNGTQPVKSDTWKSIGQLAAEAARKAAQKAQSNG